MLSRRPLLYLTIPSLALLLGLWFRRKKAIASSRANNAASSASGKNTTNASAENNTAGGIPQEASRIRGKRDISESVPIGSGPDGADENSLLNTSGCSSTSSDKGGRPTSGPNSRSPPIPITNKPGCGGHTSDELNSVDEFDVASSGSAADLAGSYELRNFEFVKNNHLYNKRTKGAMDVPVKVITASKSPKISPKNAFSEATSTPATKKQQQQSKPQQTPKSPKEVEVVKQRADESLSSPMAKLSLDDTKNNNNTTNVKKSDSQLSSQAPTKESTDDALNNNNKSTQGQQEPEQQQPPTANSPPLSLYSNDSGKGSSPTQSDVATAAGGVVQSHSSCYEFLVHERNVGVLIGRGGATVKKLHKRFKVHMIVRLVPNCPRPTDRVCAIMGAPSDIEAALEFIRQRMPLDRYPDLLLERVHYASSPVPSLGVKETIVSNGETDQSVNGNSNTAAAAPGAPKKPVMPNYYPVAQLPLSLSLVEGINNDVVISAILTGGHVFVQQQSHPTYQQLQALHATMAQSYAAGDSPGLDVPKQDSICVAPVAGVWYRVVIVNPQVAEVDGQPMCLVKFLDFGGFVTVPSADLRQIRADFMTLPFQSIECVLSNVSPIGGEWAPAATDLVMQLSSGRVLQAQVAGYTFEGLPEVFLYAPLGPDNIAFINQELVAQGYADWIEEADEEEVETHQEVLAQ